MASIVAYSGVVRLTRKELKRLEAANQKLDIKVAGLLVVARNVPAGLAQSTVGRLQLKGVLHARPEVKAVLRSKTTV